MSHHVRVWPVFTTSSLCFPNYQARPSTDWTRTPQVRPRPAIDTVSACGVDRGPPGVGTLNRRHTESCPPCSTRVQQGCSLIEQWRGSRAPRRKRHCEVRSPEQGLYCYRCGHWPCTSWAIVVLKNKCTEVCV